MEIVDFLRDYWQYFSVALVVICDLIFVLLKKPYKVYGYYLDFVNWVSEAEKKFGSGHGDEKFEYVFNKYRLKYSDTNYVFARGVVKGAVEKILDTPQRKQKGD